MVRIVQCIEGEQMLTILLLIIYLCLAGMAGLTALGVEGEFQFAFTQDLIYFIIDDPGFALMIALGILVVAMIIDGFTILAAEQAKADAVLEPYLRDLEQQNAQLESSIRNDMKKNTDHFNTRLRIFTAFQGILAKRI